MNSNQPFLHNFAGSERAAYWKTPIWEVVRGEKYTIQNEPAAKQQDLFD